MRKPYFRKHVGNFVNVIRTSESENVFTTSEKYFYVYEIMDVCLYLISLYSFLTWTKACMSLRLIWKIEVFAGQISLKSRKQTHKKRKRPSTQLTLFYDMKFPGTSYERNL